LPTIRKSSIEEPFIKFPEEESISLAQKAILSLREEKV
jgi:hypothetical protein